ncbi:MAG: HTTM domain-containing protein [Pirellulales bacterium]|nr:HTTM domain-containing protein [Pirellulales bacterium]
MKSLVAALRAYLADAWGAWNTFWFSPTDPATLSLIRLLAGGMLFYTHLIWSLDLSGFIGPEGYVPVWLMHASDGDFPAPWSVWSVFFWIESTWLLWTVHVLALLVFAALAAGFFSRIAALLALPLAISYAHRVTPGAFFGLDKVNCMLAMYLVLGPCGARYSLDRLWRLRRGDSGEPAESVGANLAMRLLQVHLCIFYLFSGLPKLDGQTWQLGTALWWAAAITEYRSFSLLWTADWPKLTALLTHATVFWEILYCCLVWNRFTRPIVLGMALCVHGGIALFMGMITFGTAMIIANLSFLQPTTVRRFVDPIAARISLALVGKKVG